LGLEEPIDFTRLTKSELERLLEALTTPAIHVRIGAKGVRRKVMDRPLRELLDRPLRDLVGEAKGLGKGGIFGLGILPSLRERARREE